MYDLGNIGLRMDKSFKLKRILFFKFI